MTLERVRHPYVHGTLLAVRRVMQVAGMVRGLDRLLFEAEPRPPKA
jgi:hypothetical protein